MDSQQIKIRIGLVCVAFLVATVVLIMLFGGGKMPRWFSSDYELFVVLPQAPMLSENSPIYKNGVKIGRVTNIQLVDDDRNVEITARIDGNVRVYSNEECRLSLNLLGQSSLNFSPIQDAPQGPPLNKGDRIDGITPIDLLKVANTMQSDVSRVLENVSAAAEQLTASFEKINQVIGSPEEVARKQQQLEEMVAQAAETMGAVRSVLGSVDELISDPEIKQGIKISSTQLPGVIEEGRVLMANINRMSDQVALLLQRVDSTIGKVDGNLDNISSFTQALGSDGTQLLESLADVAGEFKVAASRLSEFTRALNDSDGSIGQLINDPEFFQSISNTVRNANQTIQNLERITVQLKPILQDVNVFSDKIARQPSLLGLRGVLDNSPPTKGTPDAFANPWGTGDNGIPQRQSERIQWQRTPHSKLFPLGRQQFRNETLPQQNRYASQVIDLPDEMPYSAQGEYGEEYYNAVPVSENMSYPVETQNRPLYIVPAPRITGPLNTAFIQPVDKEPAWVGNISTNSAMPAAQFAQGGQDDFVLEIDFSPETGPQLSPPLSQPLPLRLASGHETATQVSDSQIVPASHIVPVQQNRESKTAIPSYSPTF